MLLLSWVIINNKDSVLWSQVQDGLLRMETLPKHAPETQAYICILSAVLTWQLHQLTPSHV
jgi:hypothetical protein